MSKSIRAKSSMSSALPAAPIDDTGSDVTFDLPQSASGASQTATGAGAASETASEAAEVAETTAEANKIIEKVGEKTSNRHEREKIIEKVEMRRGFRHRRQKRRAIMKALDRAGGQLRKKTKVSLVDDGKTVRVRSKTGQVVTGKLEKGETSKVLVAADGSKVALIDKSASRKEIIEEVKTLVTQTIEDAGRDFHVDLSGGILQGLEEWFKTDFGAFLVYAYFVPTIAHVVSDLIGDDAQEQRLRNDRVVRQASVASDRPQ